MIIDASVAFKWFAVEEGSEAALSLLDSTELYSPALIASEVANAFWKKAMAEQLAQVTSFAEDLSRLVRLLTIVDETPLMGRALEIARELKHPAYDCVYLALAEARGDVVVTADARFIAKLATTPFAGIVKPLAEAVA